MIRKMLKNILIFLSLFFCTLNPLNAKNFSLEEINKIKEKVIKNNEIIKKKRNFRENIVLKKEFKEIKPTYDLIKKKEWKKAFNSSKKNSALNKLVEWYFLRDNKDPKLFLKTKKFIENNPRWPDKVYLRKKNELFIGSDWDENKIINYFKKNPPLTTKGATNYIDALKKVNGIESIKKQASDIWINRRFTRSQSKYFYKKNKSILTKKDHLKRIEKLTWEGRTYEARRMLPLINKNYRSLYSARIILRRRAGNADYAVSNIPNNLINDEGLIYERLRWRRKSRLYDTAIELIDPLPNELKYEKKWWYEVSILIRNLLERKKYKKAYKLAKDFGSKSKIYLSEAEWMAGWIAYEFLNLDINLVINHFLNSYENTTHIGEKTKSAYWVARSYDKIKDKEKANMWYEISSKEVTTFYGQLSFEEIKKNINLIDNEDLYGKNLINKEDLNLIKTDLYKASEYVLLYGQKKIAKIFVTKLIYNCKTPGEFQLVARLAEKYKRPDLAIKASRIAMKNNIYLYHFGYPSINYKIFKGVEKELVYAVIRQESLFDTNAKSHAGARGLMQIMPATGKKISKKLKVKYSKSRLNSDPRYNVLLGSYYLNSLNKEYESYLLALVGYNAGTRKINRWIKKYGDPRKSNIDPVSWIEKIPIKETRLYVKFVLSNLQVYRQKNQNSKNKKIISKGNSI